jgi:hypothetical protein
MPFVFVTSRDVLIFISDTNNEPGRDSQIILMVINAVSEHEPMIDRPNRPHDGYWAKESFIPAPNSTQELPDVIAAHCSPRSICAGGSTRRPAGSLAVFPSDAEREGLSPWRLPKDVVLS